MTDQEARQWVTLLAAHYPRVQLQQAHYDAYAAAVARYPAAGAAEVLSQITARCVHWPAVAEVAQAFATAAVGAPLATIAWEQVQAYVAYRPTMADCPRCGGTGDDPEQRQLSCRQCRGRCEVDTGARPALHPVAKRALDTLGGVFAVRSHEQPSIMRSQFIRAYDDFMQLATQAAALGRGWEQVLQLAGPQHRVLTAGG